MKGVYVTCRVGHFHVTLQAKVNIAGDQHLVVNRPVWIVASSATVAHGMVLEDEGAGLGRMTLHTGLVFAHQSGAATLDCGPLMRIVAIVAAHTAVHDWVGAWQMELPLLIKVALEARFGVVSRVNDLTGDLAAVFSVERTRTVAGLTTDHEAVFVAKSELGV